uniref:TNFR-Cys domain-containing protein n=1 Tax=Oreochromis niloticus TaxID=8128 RepID=A0A669ELE1_ORENI
LLLNVFLFLLKTICIENSLPFFILTGNRVKTDCTETANTSCVACKGGTHMDQPSGRKQCIHCTICDLSFGLKENRTCTSTLDTVCEPQDGFYCVDLAAGSCVAAHKHRQCQPGEYIRQTGTAFRDTECSVCSKGTFSDGTLKFCRPHRPCESLNLKLIRPGNATTDAQCDEQDENVVLSWIITGCLLLILLIVILVALCLFRKKIGCLKRARKASSPPQSVQSCESRTVKHTQVSYQKHTPKKGK